MANKKISQLTSMGTVGIGSEDYFVNAENLGGGNYATVKSTALQVSEYVLNPISATQISGDNKNIYFDNDDNWVDASNQSVESFPFLQVRKSDGLLVTGSGIAFDTTAVPWNYKAAQDIQMQGQNITGAGNIGFGSNNSIEGLDRSRIYNPDGNGTDLELLGYQNLTLSGNNNILLKGQGVDATLTPFVGNVRITGGNLDVDPGYKLIVNEIQAVQGSAANDDAAININGASSHTPALFASYNSSNNYSTLQWRDSNIQYRTLVNSTASFFVDMDNATDGQTLTFYLRNNSGSTLSPTFRYPNDASINIKWGDQYAGSNGPVIYGTKTNVYTMVRIGNDIFCSAITGYAN